MRKPRTCLAVALTSFFLAQPDLLEGQGSTYQDGDVFASIDGGRVARFSQQGDLREVLRNGTRSTMTGICFDLEKNLYATNFNLGTMSAFDSEGRLTHKNWGGPFSGKPESCVVDSAGHIYVGEVDGRNILRKFDARGRLLDSFRLAPDARGIDWIDLAADQCTMFYTSEGSRVKRYDVCRKRQLMDFAINLDAPCFALRLRENGELLVTCRKLVYRLNPQGQRIRAYPISRGNLFSMNLDPDGVHFWVAPTSGEIYKVNIDTGHGARRPLFNAVANVGRRPSWRDLFDGGVTLGGLAIYGERTAAIAEEVRRSDRRKKAEEEARRKAEEEARRRRGKVTFGPASALDFGEMAASNVATRTLDLRGTYVEGTAIASVTSSLDAFGLVLEIETRDGWRSLGSRPISLEIEQRGRRTWPLRLRIGSCAPGIPATPTHDVTVEAPGLDQPTVRLRVPIAVTVIKTPGLRCWWPALMVGAAVLLVGVGIYGCIAPARFPPRLGVVLSPEEDMSEGFFHPIRQQRGSSAGFYRAARIYVSADFRLQGRAAGALARLRADRGGVYVKPMHGALVWRQTVDGSWEEQPSQESRARPGAVYCDDLRTLFFELRNR